MYRILVRYTSCVQPLSCDEALLDVTGLTGGDPEIMARAMRAEIERATGCTASAGQCCLSPRNVPSAMPSSLYQKGQKMGLFFVQQYSIPD